MTLFVLSVAALGIVASIVSFGLGASLPWLDRLASWLPARQRARFWLGLAFVPLAVGVMAVSVSFLPAIGVGHDHCLTHGPHHPHLCPHHVGGAPGVLLFVVAAVVLARVGHVILELARGLRSSAEISRALADVSDRRGDLFVFNSDEPQAFVLGFVRPRVHVSTGLLAMGSQMVEPVLAHERVHADHHDLSWRALCPVLALGHLPTVSNTIRSRLTLAQEIAADVEGAERLTDGRIRVAEALLRLARIAPTPTGALSFTHAFTEGDLKARVVALLETTARATWLGRLILVASFAGVTLVTTSRHAIHHGLETVLGALS